MNADRLAQAASFGCETVDLSKGDDLADLIEQVLGEREVDAAVERRRLRGPRSRRGSGRGAGHGAQRHHDRLAGGRLAGHPGLYVTGDPGAVDDAAKEGQIGVKLGLGWAKSHAFVTGQCPVKKYNRQLMNMILADKAHIAKAVNATTISLDDAPRGYQEFDAGSAKKYVIDPHGMVA